MYPTARRSQSSGAGSSADASAAPSADDLSAPNQNLAPEVDHSTVKKVVPGGADTILGGVFRGAMAIGGGVAAGVAGLVAAPVIGAQEHGAQGALAGLGVGLVGAVALPLVGVASGVSEVFAGVVNTPSYVQATTSGKEWDSTTNECVL